MGLDTGGLHATLGINYRPGKATSNVNHRELLPDVIHGLFTGEKEPPEHLLEEYVPTYLGFSYPGMKMQ